MQILVAADLTMRSVYALDRGFQLARQLKSDLHVVHAIDSDMPDEIRKQAVEWSGKCLAQEVENRRRQFDVSARVEIRIGKPYVEIVRSAAEVSAALLVIGIKDQKSASAKPFAETTAGCALKHSLAPTLLVKNPVGEPYRRVVCGVDFTLSCVPAMRQAMQVAPEAEIDLVHGYHVPFQGFLGSNAFRNDVAYERRLELDDFLRQEMTVLESRARAESSVDRRFRFVLREGDPQTVLRTAVRESNADLIVIATHGRGALTRAIWGSVAVDLLNDPPTDVLVIKPF